jgi:hypothetical protein
MIEDLTMLANLPVVEDEAEDKAPEQDGPVTTAQSEADKAAAGETLPPAKEKHQPAKDDTKAERVARRGQDPPEQEGAGEEDRG